MIRCPIFAAFLCASSILPAATPANMPWNIDKLSAAPAFAWQSKDTPVQSLTYRAESYLGKASSVFAYYASPATLKQRAPGEKEKFPGVVLIHGGGGTAFKVWAERWAKRGYAAIAMDLGGVRPDEADPKQRTRLPDGGPDQSHKEKFNTIASEDLLDDWPYHAVSNAVLAHSLLRSFPEVDAERTAVTGISWGGYTTCIVASVDSRFKAAVPVYGCGFLNENSAWLDVFEKLGPGQTARWVKLYDPGTWLPQNQVPTFFVNGTNDFAYPLDSYMKSYNCVPAAKNIRIQVKMSHSHEAGWMPEEIGRFVDQQLGVNQVPVLPEFAGLPEIKDGSVTALIKTVTPLKKAELAYALPGGPVNKREWTVVPASITGSMIQAPAPPAEADLYFFNATDELGSMISSPVAIQTIKK